MWSYLGGVMVCVVCVCGWWYVIFVCVRVGGGFQEWSEDESEEDESQQQPMSREDSGIQVDGTPQEDQERSEKMAQLTWTGKRTRFIRGKQRIVAQRSRAGGR